MPSSFSTLLHLFLRDLVTCPVTQCTIKSEILDVKINIGTQSERQNGSGWNFGKI